MESKTVHLFSKLSFVTLLGTVFLSLFFFTPYVPVTLDASKGFIVSVGVTLALFFWLIARLGEGKFSIPKDRLILFAGILPLVFLLASLFSSSLYISFFGSGFEMGTFGSMLILFVLFFLSALYFQTEQRIWYFYTTLFIGALIVAVFAIISSFVNIGSIRFFQGVSSGNLIGSWNDFAFFFGLMVILSIFTIEFLKSTKLARAVQYFLFIIGLAFLAIVNVPLVWLIVGLFAAIIFIYSISIQQAGVRIIHGGGDKKRFPFIALIVVFVCFIFLVGSNSVGGLVAKYIRVSNTEVIRPSLVTTGQIAWKAFKHNPFFGTGPNTFVIDWALWQPKDIAQTIFWNIDFVSGFSSLATFLVTTGVIGFVAWLLFLFTFFTRGITSLRIALQNTLSNYFIMTTLITATYSWVSIIFYTPNVVMFVLAFLSSGMLVGVLVYNQAIKVKHISFLQDPRMSFFSILAIMIIMIVTLSTTYVYAEKFASIIYFAKASQASGSNTAATLGRAEQMLLNSLSLDKNDIYYRSLSQVYIAEIQSLVSDKSVSEDTLKSSIRQLVTSAEQSARLAISQNPKQYINYVNLGNIYASFVPLGVEKSYESAAAAYDNARTFAPNNPAIILARASLEVINKNNTEARKYIGQALDLKVNYTDALFMLAQIETNEGNTSAAIKQVEKASMLTPTDPTIFFRLGLLRYNTADYAGAVSAFEQAVILNTSYLNARFFLGQSYQKVGRTSDALIQFKILNQVLPDNQDVKDALNSINAPQQPVVTTPTSKTPSPKTSNKKTTNSLPANQ